MGWDGMDGMDGVSKVFFNFLHTLWVYTKGIYLLIHVMKIAPTFLWVLKFDLRMGWDGMDGMDGWDGWMGYQKCPSIFFILCGYIHKVYTYLYI